MGMPEARILTIGEGPGWETWFVKSPELQGCVLENAAGSADALQRLRSRSFEVLVTDPRTSIPEDLALLLEVGRIRPGLRTLVLAPEAAPADVIAALRARVFACFTAPFDPREVVNMVAKALQEPDWRRGIEVLSAQPDWISLRVTCRLLNAERLVRFMTEMRADLAEDQRDSLLMAFREMLLNAMEHGAGFDPEKVVQVTAARTARAIVYHFRDPGPGFQKESLAHAALSYPADQPLAHVQQREALGMRPGGWGILIASQLVDELIYNETGNEVLLIKHVQTHQSRSA
ncbi:MAG TPA: ATP-binding protein [Terriglobia bacterium]|nr:ATP-binding protein [Terriglobia bacterium]